MCILKFQKQTSGYTFVKNREGEKDRKERFKHIVESQGHTPPDCQAKQSVYKVRAANFKFLIFVLGPSPLFKYFPPTMRKLKI